MIRDDIMGADTAHPQTVECLQEVIADPVICHWCGSVFTDHQCGAEGVLMLHETATPAPVRTRIWREGWRNEDLDDPIWWPWAPPADQRDPWDGKTDGTQREAQP